LGKNLYIKYNDEVITFDMSDFKESIKSLEEKCLELEEALGPFPE